MMFAASNSVWHKEGRSMGCIDTSKLNGKYDAQNDV
jgi:hypothetical protein